MAAPVVSAIRYADSVQSVAADLLFNSRKLQWFQLVRVNLLSRAAGGGGVGVEYNIH